MRKASLAGLIMFFMLLPWRVAWAGPTAEGLLALLPPEIVQAGKLTRGGFAVMLAAAAQIKGEATAGDLPVDVSAANWAAPALKALWQQGIIRGFPNGSLRPEQEITSLEAVILSARVLGLPNEISSPGTELPVGNIPYGFNQYAFFYRQGLVPPVAPMANLTPAAAASWLAAVFASDPGAENLLSQCRRALVHKQGMATRGEASIRFASRPGLPTTMELDRLVIKGEVSNEFLLPGQMHQVTSLDLEGRQSLRIEQVVLDNTLYRQVMGGQRDPGGWQRLSLSPDVSLLVRQQQNLGLPAAIYPYLHCRNLGESKIEGREVLGISFYTRLNKAGTASELLPPAAWGEGLENYLNLPEKLIRSFSYWGLVYLDPDTLLPVKSDLNLVLAFAPEYQGRPAPMAAVEMRYRVDSYKYDNIKITLPAAVAAPIKEYQDN